MKTVVCTNERGDSVEAPIESLEFRPSVYGVLIKDDHVLLARQWEGYDFPGGGVEKHETIEEALVREVQEETGVIVTKGDMLYMHQQFFVHPVTKKCFNAILFYYKCDYVSGDPSTHTLSDKEFDYAKPGCWLPLSEVTSDLKMYNPVDTVALVGLAKALSSFSS